MSCSTLKGINFSLCEPSMGGIVRLYLCNADEVSAITIGTASTLSDEGITAITMSGSSKFQEFTIRKNTSSFTSTMEKQDNGSVNISTVLSFVMPRMDSAKRAAMQSLLMAEAFGLVKDANGKYWFLGSLETDSYLENTSGSAETGVQRSDANQYTVELTVNTNEYPYEVTEDAVSSVIA